MITRIDGGQPRKAYELVKDAIIMDDDDKTYRVIEATPQGDGVFLKLFDLETKREITRTVPRSKKYLSSK